MKIEITRTLILFCFAGTIMVTSCKKNDYLSGGSLHDPVTLLSNTDYLKSNSFNLFDTAVQIIDRLGLTNEVNNAKTFFAFTDYSVVNFMNLKLQAKQAINPLATYTLDSLIKDISPDSVRQYMFNQTIELSTATEFKATPYTSLGNTSMGVLKQLQTAAPYTTSTQAPTYLLYFAKVRGALDEPGVIPPPNENDILVLCQTTGIKTTPVKSAPGTNTLHVLANTHTFVRF